MFRKLMLSLVAVAALTGCLRGEAFGPCVEYGSFDGDSEPIVQRTSCPEPVNETDVVIPDGGTS